MTTTITALTTFIIGTTLATIITHTILNRHNNTHNTLPHDQFDHALHHAQTLINQGLPGKALNYLNHIEQQLNTHHQNKTQAINNHKKQATHLIQHTNNQ